MQVTQEEVPFISICVPTHHGRKLVLSTLLNGIVEQARDLPGLVEVCVSDNASHDGTEEMISGLARTASCHVSYHRQPKDLGLAHNLLTSVELARGNYCWLLGSDDLLADGALKRVIELMKGLPSATGYVIGAIHVDGADPALRSRQLPRAFHPPGEQARLIEGLDEVYDQCGNAWCALSWSVVDRYAWLRSAQKNIDLVLAHPVFPQVVVLAGMAVERPIWGWLAEPLVRQRNATTFLFERDDVSLADRWSQIIGGVAAVWGAVLGRRGGASWRRRMRMLHQVWGGADDIRATKLYDQPTVSSQGRLARVCLGAFWPSRIYWTEILGATLMPVWLMRARYGDEGRLACSQSPIPEGLSLSARLPKRLRAGSIARVNVELYNSDKRTGISSAGPDAATIGQRWFAVDGRALEPEELGLNAIAGMPQSLPHGIRAGHSLQLEPTLFAPVDPGLYRVAMFVYQHGRRWADDFTDSQMVIDDVEVVRE